MKAYVYEIIVDGVVRYIGKGSGGRARSHLTVARRVLAKRNNGEKVRTSKFYNRLAKALGAGSDIAVRIVRRGMTDAEALAFEVAAIAAAPCGSLWNQTAGGDGSVIIDESLRMRLSELARQRYRDPEERRKLSESNKVASQRPGVREARVSRGLEIASRPGASEAKSAAMKKAHNTPEFRAKRSRIAKSLWDEQRRAEFGQASRAMWSDGAHKDAHRAALKHAWSRPETVAKHRAYLDSPEGRENLRRAALKAAEARRAKAAAKSDS